MKILCQARSNLFNQTQQEAKSLRAYVYVRLGHDICLKTKRMDAKSKTQEVLPCVKQRQCLR